MKVTKDTDAKVREQAAVALGVLGSTKQEADCLQRLLTDQEPLVRRAAVDALREMGRPAVHWAGEVAKLLNDSNTRVRSAAANCLVGFGAAGAEVLVKRLLGSLQDPGNANQPALRDVLDALQALGSDHIDPYAELLAAFFASSQPDLRSTAWACLLKVGPSGQEKLAKLFDDPYVPVRIGVAEALGQLLSGSSKKLGHHTSTEVKMAAAVAEQLLDTSDVVRAKAAEALGRIGGKLAEPHIAELSRRLEEHDVRIHRSVLDALAVLGELSDPHARHVAVRLEATEAPVRCSAAKALGQMSGNAGVAYVQNLAYCAKEDRDPDVRRCAAEAIGLLGRAPQVAAVINQTGYAETLACQMLEDKSPAVRKACAEALGRLGQWAGDVVRHLSLALQDSSPEVRHVAAQSLACVGEAVAPEVIALIRALEDLAD